MTPKHTDPTQVPGQVVWPDSVERVPPVYHSVERLPPVYRRAGGAGFRVLDRTSSDRA